MSDLYSEQLVAKNPTPLEAVGKILIIGFTVLSGLAGIAIHPLILALTAVGVVLIFWLVPKLSVEYEYLHVNGELDIDKIFSKQQRKKALAIDLKQLEILAPVGSHRLDSYNNMNGVKTYDFSSKTAGRKVYALMIMMDKGMNKVLLELDDKMLNDIKLHAPRKVFTD